MMLGKYFKKTVFRKEHTADGVVPEAPQGILKKCNACKGAIFTEDVKRNLYICPKCGNYFRVHAYRRIEFLLDDGSFEEWDQGMTAGNPLGFPGYEEKVRALQERTGLTEAVVTGKGRINGMETVILFFIVKPLPVSAVSRWQSLYHRTGRLKNKFTMNFLFFCPWDFGGLRRGDFRVKWSQAFVEGRGMG